MLVRGHFADSRHVVCLAASKQRELLESLANFKPDRLEDMAE